MRRLRKWIEVSRKHPCPVCCRTHYCLIALDHESVVCTLIREGCKKRSDGSDVEFENGHGWVHAMRTPVTREHAARVLDNPVSTPAWKWNSIVADSIRFCDPAARAAFVRSLGLTLHSAIRFVVGRIGPAWSFPMRDAYGSVIGIRLRQGGAKFSVVSSRSGMFFDPTYIRSPGEPCFIVEGPTDAMALHGLGVEVVGRSHNTGNNRMLAEMLWSRPSSEGPRRVVIVADNDDPGREGADALADHLCREGVEDVRVITPPAGVKDAREAVIKGLIKSDLMRVVRQTPPRRPNV